MEYEILNILQGDFNTLLQNCREILDHKTQFKNLQNEIQNLKEENKKLSNSEMWKQLNEKNIEIKQLQNEINFLKKDNTRHKNIVTPEILNEGINVKNNEPEIIITEEINEELPEKKKKKKKKKPIVVEEQSDVE